MGYDRKKRAFTRFDIVALGDTWGRWGDANRKSMYVECLGRSPFGFAFELATAHTWAGWLLNYQNPAAWTRMEPLPEK